MKLFKLNCGCVVTQPRPLLGTNKLKYLRLHSCKTRDFCFEEVVSGQPIMRRLTKPQAVACMNKMKDLVQAGIEYREIEKEGACSHA